MARRICWLDRPLRLSAALAFTLPAFLVLGDLRGSGSASAQESPPEAAPPTGEAPAAIPASRIPAEIQKLEDELLRIAQHAGPSPRIERIEAALPDYARTIRQQSRRDVRRLDAEVDHRAVLTTVLSEWQARSEKLSEWQAEISTRSELLAKDFERLSEMRQRYRTTRAGAEENSLSAVLIERLDGALIEVAKTRKQIDLALAPLLTMQDEVVSLIRVTQDVMSSAEARQKEMRDQIFTIDRVPFWRLEPPQESHDLLRNVQLILEDEAARVAVFAGRKADALITLGVFWLGLASLFRALLDSARRHDGEAALAWGAAAGLQRPVAAASMIAMMILIFGFETTPLLMRSGIGVLMIVPILRLLGPVGLGQLRLAAIGLAAWLAYEVARQNFVQDDFISRWALLLLSLLVLAVFLWLLRPGRVLHLEAPSAVLAVIAVGMKVVPVMALISIIANMTGNVAFADLMIEGSLVTLYVGLIVRIIQSVAIGAFAGILRTRRAERLNVVRRHAALIEEKGAGLLRFAALFFWLYVALDGLRIRNVIWGAISSTMTSPLAVGEIEIALIDVTLSIFVVWLAFKIARFVCFVLDEDVLPRASLPRGVPFAISTMVRYVILVVGFMLAVAASGMDTSRFALLVGALGVGVGIGLQDVVNNFVSGLILLFERPIQQGDTVELNGQLGDVKRIGLRSSTVRTFSGGEVVIPNSSFVSKEFVNWTLSDRLRRIDIPIGVAYGSDADRVLAVLRRVADEHPDIQSTPSPMIIFKSFGDSSLDFELRGWTADFDNWLSIRSELGVGIINALDEAGIVIPFPQQDLHLRSVAPDALRDLGAAAGERPSESEEAGARARG